MNNKIIIGISLLILVAGEAFMIINFCFFRFPDTLVRVTGFLMMADIAFLAYSSVRNRLS